MVEQSSELRTQLDAETARRCAVEVEARQASERASELEAELKVRICCVRLVFCTATSTSSVTIATTIVGLLCTVVKRHRRAPLDYSRCGCPQAWQQRLDAVDAAGAAGRASPTTTALTYRRASTEVDQIENELSQLRTSSALAATAEELPPPSPTSAADALVRRPTRSVLHCCASHSNGGIVTMTS